MPWPEGGQSWVQKVETGFSNLHYYKYKKGIEGSRSGYAIQLEKWGIYLPGSYYKPVGYISPMVTWWHKEIQRPVHMDATSIAASITRLIDDEGLWQRLATQSREIILKTHGYDAVSTHFNDFLGQMSRNGRGTAVKV